MNEQEVKEIIEEFEKEGLVFKTWDIKKQDYVWHKTEFGEEVYEHLVKEGYYDE